jgi:hypothetical protein
MRRTLTAIMRVVIEEAERNPEFEARLVDAMKATANTPNGKGRKAGGAKEGRGQGKIEDEPIPGLGSQPSVARRPSNRRPAAVLNPIKLARRGEQLLRGALAYLTLEQLLDIVADYGMDTGKLVIKWRSPARIIDRIVEVSIARAQKGDAFREPVSDQGDEETN